MKCFLIASAKAVFVLSSSIAMAADKVTVILDDNVAQMRQSAQSLAYQGDPALHDAFRTLQTRLQTILVSSGRVDVKPKTAFGQTLTQEKVYLCSYTLVQGHVVNTHSGKNDGYIIGLNLQGWNYLTETPLQELTRTVDLKIPATSPETALAYVARYLAFITLEAISPVKVLEREGNDININVGCELLKKGDMLQVREGFRKKALARVIETDTTTAVAELTDGDLSIVKVGSPCRFVLPDAVEESNVNASPHAKGPTIKVTKVKVTTPSTTINSFKVESLRYKGRAGGIYRVAPQENIIDLSSLPEKLSMQLRTAVQGTGINLLSMNQSSEQDDAADYVLECVISNYSESHTNGRTTDSGTLIYQQKAALTVHIELRGTEHDTVAMIADVDTAVPERVTMRQRAKLEDVLIADCARKIAEKIQGATAK